MLDGGIKKDNEQNEIMCAHIRSTHVELYWMSGTERKCIHVHVHPTQLSRRK